MGLSSQNMSGKFKLTGLGDDTKPFEVSGDLEYDPKFEEFPYKISLYGYHSDYLKLISHVGALIELTKLNKFGDSTQKFIGRVHGAGWNTGALSSEISRIATLFVKKAINEFNRPDSKFRHASYTYTTDVEQWPGRGVYGVSYEGTVELRRFRGGIGRLFSGKKIKLEAYPHYIFNSDKRHMSRRSLASISAYWSESGVDWKKYIESARLALSFSHVVKLHPIALSFSDAGIYRKLSWDADTLEKEVRGRVEQPIDPSKQRKFHSRAIQHLVRMEYDQETLSSIVDRYVESRTDATLQRSFSHGCEAIEGIYLLLSSKGKKRKKRQADEILIREIRKVIKASSIAVERKEIALSRAYSLIDPPVWAKIVDQIGRIERDKGKLIHRVIERANFFRYRNLLAHGRMVRLQDEVVFQHHLMQFVLEWLFIRLCGSTIEPKLGVLESDLDSEAAPDLGIIQLWE